MKKRDVLERDFLKWVTDTAVRHGWRWWHVPMPIVAERSGRGYRPYKAAAGLPDLFLLHSDPPRMVIAEVKGSGGKLSDAQREFLSMARDVAEHGCDGVVTPQGMRMKVVGVYVFEPGMEAAITQLLQSRVLT